MTDEFELLKNNIRSITSQDFNTAFSLIGRIVGHTQNMQYCDVEVQMNGGIHTFSNIPAHGFPVDGSSGIIHFHNGNLEQPVCDCAYRLNPPTENLNEYYTSGCYNYVDNGNFIYGANGFNTESHMEKITLHPDAFTAEGDCCLLEKKGSFIEFKADISQCENDYFKLQFNYRGLGTLKVEVYNDSTNKVIRTVPLNNEYTVWTSEMGRFGWSYNKEVYPHKTSDGTVNDKIRVRITNNSDEYREQWVPKSLYSGNKSDIIEEVGESYVIRTPISMTLDGLLVYDENGDTSFYPSENDMKKKYGLK